MIFLTIILSILFLYCLLLKFAVRILLKKITKNSLGYITNITYKDLNYLNLTLANLTFCSPSFSFSSIKISSIRVSLYIDRITISFPDEIILLGSENINFIRFQDQPIFDFKIRNNELKIRNKLSLNFYDSNNNQIMDRNLAIDRFKIQNGSRRNKIFEINFDYHYAAKTKKSQKSSLDMIIQFGKSERTRTNYIKSFNIVDYKIKLHSSELSAYGFLDYHRDGNPTGKIVVGIINPRNLTQDIFTEKNEISQSIDSFLELMLNKSEKNHNKLNLIYNFSEDSVKINELNLCEIRRIMKT